MLENLCQNDRQNLRQNFGQHFIYIFTTKNEYLVGFRSTKDERQNNWTEFRRRFWHTFWSDSVMVHIIFGTDFGTISGTHFHPTMQIHLVLRKHTTKHKYRCNYKNT